MKADILIKDVNESSCIVTIYYSKFSFDSWFSYAKPFGSGISGDCSRFGVTSIHLLDGRNIVDLEVGPTFIPEVMISAGRTGGGFVKSSGFLQTGKIVWQVWNTRRTGAWLDDTIEQRSIN